MTSAQKIRSNRANARASTGPKSDHGRHRSAQNALRHGLSVCSSPAVTEEIRRLAGELVGPSTDPEIEELAHRIAEAQIEVCRVRHARHQLLSWALGDLYHDSRPHMQGKGAVLRSLLRSKMPDIALTDLVSFLNTTPEGPRKLAQILSQEVMQLMSMDRYERRALSRRRFAIRAFDEARRRIAPGY